MFGFFCGKRKKGHCGKGCCEQAVANAADTPPADSIPLSEAEEDKRLIVKANSDIKTMEMGLYPGSMVRLMHNSESERNVIVKIHDQRYVIPREIADNIYVKK